ncbi:ANR family transcriptional regulator [Vibrio sp. Vb2880]|uniref:ANR family transcriptional regulator n=1 Tax=Vibrio sp. Vb2880 TaxID=2816076 RepID=UPI001A8C53AD|nr:ANR family transcriptional regulator [Vibrio sp. Vb2880]MBO0216224.1 ANR family transcriptional regulator [Vibrio sp. Vb2880]
MPESNFYMDAATKAAEAEKAGEFSYASQLWESASYAALSGSNPRWSQARADLCQDQQRMMRTLSWESEAING